jgi:hypothetical protein
VTAPHPVAPGNQDNSGVAWVVLQQEDGAKLVKQNMNLRVVGAAPLRRLLGPWGDWHLFKAQAVRGLWVLLCCSVSSLTKWWSWVAWHHGYPRPRGCCWLSHSSCALQTP